MATTNSTVTLTRDGNGIRVQTTYPIDFEGQVAISVVVPVMNPSLLELQAIACEQAAAGLQSYADSFRASLARQAEEGK